MSRIKDENYYQITGWMLNRLELKGIALEIYAIVYGFSQDGESEFKGSISYLCDFTGTSRPTVIKALKDLVASDYLIKIETEINGVKFNKYKVNLQVVKEFNRGSKETLQGGSKETLPNNNTIDNKPDNDIKKERKTSYDDILSGITNAELKALYLEYIKMRKLIKAPMTDRALQMLIKKVNELEPDSINNQKQMLETAIMNNWKSVYPIRMEANNGQSNSTSNKKCGDEYAFLG